MNLDRGTLARIDRKVVAALRHDEVYRTVRVSATEATWSTWKRYCDAAGISMGRAIMELIGNELRSVLVDPASDSGPMFAGLVDERLKAREAQIVARKRAIDEGEARLRGWANRLRATEADLRALERQLRAQTIQATRPAEFANKFGRNRRCPCKSGLKYKYCHGLPGRRATLPE